MVDSTVFIVTKGEGEDTLSRWPRCAVTHPIFACNIVPSCTVTLVRMHLSLYQLAVHLTPTDMMLHSYTREEVINFILGCHFDSSYKVIDTRIYLLHESSAAKGVSHVVGGTTYPEAPSFPVVG